MAADSNNISGGLSYRAAPLVLGGASNGSAINAGFNFDLPLATVAAFSDRALNFAAAGSAARMGFVAGAQASGAALVRGTSEQVINYSANVSNMLLDYGRDATASVERVQAGARASMDFRSILNAQTQQKVAKSAGGGGLCFITTAICEMEGKPDDCEELTLLRAFRDTYMRNDISLRNMVKEYYRVAPAYVEAIDSLPYAEQQKIYADLRDSYLKPAIACLKAGNSNGALVFYRALVNKTRAYAFTAQTEVA